MEAPSTILIVDDDARGREVLQGLLSPEGHRLELAGGGVEALQKARALRPDVILLDIMMPDMDGFDVCKAVREDPLIREIPIILVTALDDRDSLLQGLEAGADEFITKPFNRLEMRTRVRSLLRLNRFKRLNEERKGVEQALAGVVSLLSDFLSLTAPQAFSLAECTRVRSVQLAEALGYTNLLPFELAGLLSRLGSLTLPPSLLHKVANRAELTPAEKALWGRVPEITRNLLRKVPQFREAAEAIFLQEKNYDGSGFPDNGQRGTSLPLVARVLRLAADLAALDVRGIPPGEALVELHAHEGRYDPELLATLEQIIQQQTGEATLHPVIREVRFAQTQIGWRLRQDLVARDGTLLLTAGNVITQAVYERILNFAHVAGIKEPILVEHYEPASVETALTP